jgi:hypothetical protein
MANKPLPNPLIKGRSVREILGERYCCFEKLVEAGCDATTLGNLIVFLNLTTVRLLSGRTLDMKRTDRHEAMLAGLSLRDVRRKVNRARKALRTINDALDRFRDAIEPLKKARVWGRSPLGGSGVLNAWTAMVESHNAMNEIVESLDAGLAKLGPQAALTFNRQVKKLIGYVKETTGQYHDVEVSQILEAASPEGYAKFPSHVALRMWRRKHGLTDGK